MSPAGFRDELAGAPAEAIVQAHCHRKAVMGIGADRAVLDQLGLNYGFLDAGW